MRLAFGVEGYLDKETKNDPSYIKYLVRTWGKKDGLAYESILDYHVCTAEELDMFGEPAGDSVLPLEKYKGSGKQFLFCLDWDNIEIGDIAVWGVSNDDNYQRWEFVLLPCNYVHKEFGDGNDTVHEQCNSNHDDQMAYLGNMNVVMYVSDANFIRDSYQDNSIKR